MTNRIPRKLSTLAVLALSLFAWGCDSVSDMTQPELAPSGMVVKSITGQLLNVVLETEPAAGSVSKSIGKWGGTLVLGRHTLKVSANAVSAATLFTMTRDAENPLRVHLTAGRESQNDIGAAGFDAPVTLSLSFENAEDLPSDRTEISVIYYRPDGLVEELPTNVGTLGTLGTVGTLSGSLLNSLGGSTITTSGNVATATLPHFSLFGIAWP